MRSEGFSFNLGVSKGRAVFARRCYWVRNRLQPSATVRMMSLLWPCRWGDLLKVTFHGCVTCQFAPGRYYILNCIKKLCYARKVMHFAAQVQGFVLNRAVTLGSAVARLFRKLRFCDKSQAKRRFWKTRNGQIIPSARKNYNFWLSWGKWRKACFMAGAAY